MHFKQANSVASRRICLNLVTTSWSACISAMILVIRWDSVFSLFIPVKNNQSDCDFKKILSYSSHMTSNICTPGAREPCQWPPVWLRTRNSQESSGVHRDGPLSDAQNKQLSPGIFQQNQLQRGTFFSFNQEAISTGITLSTESLEILSKTRTESFEIMSNISRKKKSALNGLSWQLFMALLQVFTSTVPDQTGAGWRMRGHFWPTWCSWKGGAPPTRTRTPSPPRRDTWECRWLHEDTGRKKTKKEDRCYYIFLVGLVQIEKQRSNSKRLVSCAKLWVLLAWWIYSKKSNSRICGTKSGQEFQLLTLSRKKIIL